MNEKCFYKVSNKDIYEKLMKIERKMTIAYWTSGTALTLSILTIGLILKLA
jgi:hypothetical protein